MSSTNLTCQYLEQQHPTPRSDIAKVLRIGSSDPKRKDYLVCSYLCGNLRRLYVAHTKSQLGITEDMAASWGRTFDAKPYDLFTLIASQTTHM
ncbi:hypothetical protein PHISCL_03136 [Aspergillus sclerotialis]|uniref:Uncharacterized protein n=1 Tax=Aspergillus sclerotialis TaxID=2070753 RepID=A0A3A2ZMT0_9EURO|nr:hypothetical protein PHISCL_03136 [Aspergillus sclerotialis]